MAQGSKLADLIRKVREAKNESAEASIIKKESSIIRTNLKAKDGNLARNIIKSIYVNMLGYPTHFARMHILRLLTSTHYAEKRIGYLALMTLLDESHEELILATNSISIDLQSPNRLIVSMALTALSSIASAPMARDLSPQVEELMMKETPYLRKKACAAAIKVVRKAPDLAPDYAVKAASLLQEWNHGVLLSAVSLMAECATAYPECIPEYRQSAPQLVRILRKLTTSSYAPEYDMEGVTDPFLQVGVLKVMRIIGAGCEETSNKFNDVLAQVATNTELVGVAPCAAVLSECALTILKVESQASLRSLASNILKRFLRRSELNFRYVALNTLLQMVHHDRSGVRRHRATIVDCLRSKDVSIRRRALDLSYALVDSSNIVELSKELLVYLDMSDKEFRADLASKIVTVADKYAPDPAWHVDTVVSVLEISGELAPADIPIHTVHLLNAAEAAHGPATLRLYKILHSAMTNKARVGNPLLQVCLWAVGEFADTLVECSDRIPHSDIVAALEWALANSRLSVLTRSYAISAAAKLGADGGAFHPLVTPLVEKFKSNIHEELQVRAVEYGTLLGSGVTAETRSAVLEPAPALASEKMAARRASIQRLAGGAGLALGSGSSTPAVSTPTASAGLTPGSLLGGGSAGATSTPTAAAAALNLLDIGGGSPAPTASASPAPAASGLDLLSALGAAPVPVAAPAGGNDLLSMLSSPSPVAAVPSPAAAGGLLGALSPSPVAPAAAVTGSTQLPPWSNGVVSITFSGDKPNPAKAEQSVVHATITSPTGASLTGVAIQVAVPGYLLVQLAPASGTTVGAGAAITQDIRLINNQQGVKPIHLRLRVAYTQPGAAAAVVTADLPPFPLSL